MPTIDFNKIRSSPKSRNDSFEALAVQLFRRSCATPPGSTFVSLRGDGGDGGVEAYFRTPVAEVLGVQAKYFFKFGAAELAQLADSLDTAIANHPTLSAYWVYLPFDLTGRVAGGRRGTSEAERFEQWKEKVETVAVKRGHPLSVQLCTAAVIRSQILHLDLHGGMRRYWFDDTVLTRAQIQHGLDTAATFAGPRYSAALDVVTGAHAGLDVFGGIGNFEVWREESLDPVVGELRSLKRRGDEALSILGKPAASSASKLVDEVISACDALKDFSLAASQIVQATESLSELHPLLVKAREAQEASFYAKHGRERDTPGFRQFSAEYLCTFPAGDMDAARELEATSLRLSTVLASPAINAGTAHSLLLVGPAGIGKTHAIVSAALRRLAHGGHSLVVFGEDFGKDEPWEVIRSKLGFGAALGRQALFECLEACAESTGLPFIIYIDALNETPHSSLWKNKLPELLSLCKPYTGIKVCVSTRDTYRDLVVDSRFPGYAFEHVGFAGNEFEAVQRFATYYGLDAEITPLFSPELCNPLFLHLACKTLKAEGKTALDLSLPGFAALLESHLKHCDALVRGRLHYSNPKNLVRVSMIRLAEALTQNLPQERTWDACVLALQSLSGAEIGPEAMLKELEYEGLVIITDAGCDKWLVRLGYQRYGDMLRATSLVESVKGKAGVDTGLLAQKLRAMTVDDEGLLEALAAVLPEATGIEITSDKLGLDLALAHRLFLNALPWRSLASVTHAIDNHVFGALNTPGLWQRCYEVFFRLSLVPEHRLNATNWLGPFLQRSSLVDRDAYLSVGALTSFDEKGAVWSLVNAALRADIQRWPRSSREQCVLALAWLTSCADRRIRDLATKGLTRIISMDPGLGEVLVADFEYCDDDYILESISLSIYSACLLARGREVEFIPSLDRLLSSAFSDGQNILVRDSIRLLGRLLTIADLPDSISRRLGKFPAKARMPRVWPTISDAKPLLDLEHLPSNMRLWGEQLGTDFWRYQVESKIRDFDTEGAGISLENVASWLMTEALRLGFPGYQECALKHDLVLAGRYGTGRGRKGYAERLGKKYYWIALHRLLGILADNVPPKRDSFSQWSPAPDHLWSVDVRKTDPTDVRDISPTPDYPDEVLAWDRYSFPDRESDIKTWAGADNYLPHDQALIRRSLDGDEWIALSSSDRSDDRQPGDDSWSKPYLGMSWYYSSILVKGTGAALLKRINARDPLNNQGASCYRGYLAEYPECPVFDQIAAEGYLILGPDGALFSEVSLLRGGEWEYDYSYLTPDRQDHLRVPCPSLVKVLGLRSDRQRGWLDSDDNLVVFESTGKRRRGLFIRRTSLNAYLKATGRKLVFRRFANRGYFDERSRDGSQRDLFTWLRYRSRGGPEVMKSSDERFNC